MGQSLVPLDRLIDPREFRTLVDDDRAALGQHHAAAKRRSYPGYEALKGWNADSRHELLQLLKRLVARLDGLSRHYHSFADKAAKEIAGDQDRTWRELLQVTESHVERRAADSRELSSLQVAGIEDKDTLVVAADARGLKAHLDAGKRLGFGPFRAQVVKKALYLVKEARVDGRACDSSEALRLLLEWIDLGRALQDLGELWRPHCAPPAGTYAVQLAAYQDFCEPLRDALAVHGYVQDIKSRLAHLPGLQHPHWHERGEIEDLCAAVEAADVEDRHRKARAAFAPLTTTVREFAERHRETAREKLQECRRAIPAWVMPLYQVVQTIRPDPGIFDIVIVDEASQSGPEALFLNYIGKKLIVVGDDKQITPLHVGVNRQQVDYLRRMHLEGIPHSESLDLEGSLFAQAELRFPDRIRLREHFRCMPEIIQFSNNLSYSTEPLIPLRQYGNQRQEPVKTVHVEDGYRKGRAGNVENRPEALSIVSHIAECCEDPEYNHPDGRPKSFRVLGSVFYRDPDEALAPLCKTLDRLEIRPRSDWRAQAEEPPAFEAARETEDFEEAPEDPIPPRDEEDKQPEFEQPQPLTDETAQEATADRDTGRLDSALDWSRRRQQRPENLPPATIQTAITTVLRDCPNHTCTLKSVTGRVLKHLSIRTRGNPRADFEKRVMRNIGAMKRKGFIEEYQAKNKRIRLLVEEERTLF